MKKIYALRYVMMALCLVGYATSIKAQTTITTTASATTFWSGSGGILVFGIKNNNPYPVLLTNLSAYAPASHSATYTFWYNPTSVTGAPAAITTGNGWVQTSLSATVTNSGTAGIIPIFSGMNLQVPAGTTWRSGLVVSVNGPYYGSAGASGDIFSGGGVDIYMQGNVNSPTYTGPFPGPPTTTPRGFYGSLTFEPAGPCTDPPVTGNIVSTVNPVCSGNNFTLSLSGGTGGTGQTYQWFSSSDNSTFSPISLATGASYTGTQTASTYYRVAVTCGANTVTSSSINLTTPALVSGTFTINSGGGANFTSITDAVNSVKCGISGPVIFNVTGGGPYNEQVVIPPDQWKFCNEYGHL